MKIGLIGNMNNNNFALLRYLRDLGADAHLLLYANDGQGSLSHFKPECDTWEIEKWQSYVHQTDIPNTPIAALEFPLSWILSLRSALISVVENDDWQRPVSRHKIIDAYGKFDRLVGSGITPATLDRVGLGLDIFYPYSSGVEYLRTGEFLVRFDGRLGTNRLIFTRIAQRQATGIRSAKHVLNSEMGITNDVLLGIGTEPKRLAIPMVFNRENYPEAPPTRNLRDAWIAISRADFTILHQARLMWRNPGNYSSEAWIKENKNNHWLLHSFADLIKARPDIKTCLFIVEYGPDVDATKRLAIELGVETYIHWLPQMGRRELMWLLSHVSVGVGEFYNVRKMIWGGTGWEVLASGKPLLQGFNFEEAEFKEIYGYPPPPMLPVRTREDMLIQLLDMADHPEKPEEIGRGAKEWFNRYNGIGLAKQWMDLLQKPYALKKQDGIEIYS